MKNNFWFNEIKYPFITFALFFLIIFYHILIPQEAYCMALDNDRIYYSDPELTRHYYYDSLDYSPGEDPFYHDPFDNKEYFDITIYEVPSSCHSLKNENHNIFQKYYPFAKEFVKDYTSVLSKNSSLSSINLAFKITNEYCFLDSVYIKCQDINKHEYSWLIWDINSPVKDWSYHDFKVRWDNETNIWSNVDENIRNDIIIEVKDLLGIITVNKDLRKSVRLEVEKLIRGKPFLPY